MYIKPDAKIIRRNFGLIAPAYDRANDWMSLGLLHRWRKQLVKLSQIKPGQRVLDTATGTGDLAFLFSREVGAAGEVIGIDFTQEMLEVAREKEWNSDLPVRWMVADVMKLPFTDKQFDVTSIAFGIRNVEDPKMALREMARVTKPGGKVMILETGRPQKYLWNMIYSTYFENLIPKIGGFLSGHAGPYKFLFRSTMKFPSGEEFLEWMNELNVFQSTTCRPLLGGVAYIYEGTVAAATSN